MPAWPGPSSSATAASPRSSPRYRSFRRRQTRGRVVVVVQTTVSVLNEHENVCYGLLPELGEDAHKWRTCRGLRTPPCHHRSIVVKQARSTDTDRIRILEDCIDAGKSLPETKPRPH